MSERGQESKCMSMMSWMDKTNLRNMGKTMKKKEQHIGSIMDLRPQKISNKLTFKLQRTANEYAPGGRDRQFWNWPVHHTVMIKTNKQTNKKTKATKKRKSIPYHRSTILNPWSPILDPWSSLNLQSQFSRKSLNQESRKIPSTADVLLGTS